MVADRISILVQDPNPRWMRRLATSGLRALVIEDDAVTAQGVAETLSDAGWCVDVAADGREGLRRGVGEPFDVLVVDRMLPGLDGLALVSALRDARIETPVLILTAVGDVEERVRGFEAGGDDYLVKPYAAAELRARVHALVRRGAGTPADGIKLTVGELCLDRLHRAASRGGRAIELLPLEFKLLEVLALNAGRIVTRTMLLEQVWRFQFDPRTNIVETHISRLRRKLDSPGEAPLIATVRGAGYLLADA